MHSQKITTLLRSALAAGCALAMCATLAGCSNNSSSSSSSSKESSITATGKLGEKPKVTFKTPMTVQNNTYAVLQKGDGATIQKGDRVCAQGIAINVKDGSELMSSWEKNTPDCSILLSDSNLKQIEPYKAMIGQKLNTSIAFGINDSNSANTSSTRSYPSQRISPVPKATRSPMFRRICQR